MGNHNIGMSEIFYCDIENKAKIGKIVNELEQFSIENDSPTYVISQPLGEKQKYNYEYSNAFIVLIPGYKIIAINAGKESDAFEEYVEDLLEDVGHLSDRFDYKKVLGRPREWKNLIVVMDGEYFSIESLKDYAVSGVEERKVNLLISLLIGSINDIEKVGIDYPETLLDKVKHKIILFDGMQSRFIYEPIPDKTIRIQGLAGTGKTELLLHKLRKNYVEEKDSKIVFTCYNKVLAEDMKNRIPQFFNFMRVDEQIEWWKRLWVFPSWGSQNNPLSGMYSYICSNYGLQFFRYSWTNSFEVVCNNAIEQLKQRKVIDPCFDYVYIDESQDFPEAFFELCSMVTKKQIFIAGDIFQNVFDTHIKPSVDCHYLLNKCYRTDPHTLMLAHSVGMGLFERPVIRWLEDDEWIACGYKLERKDAKVIFTRDKIRRFNDNTILENESVDICKCESFVPEIMKCIDKIRTDNPTVMPDDIAIVFLSNSKVNYTLADTLLFKIKERYDWDACQGYITKTKKAGHLFISNVNNIKGLEFPFVICVCTEHISNSIKQRNAIYMILTRSFLNSFLLINAENEDFISCYQNANMIINMEDAIIVREPSEEEKEQQAEKIRIETSKYGKSIEDIIDQVCLDYPNLTSKNKEMLYSTIPNIIEDGSEDDIVTKTIGMIKVMQGN